MRLTDFRHVNVDTTDRTLTPRGDFVLVRRKLELEDRGPNKIVAVDWQRNPKHGLKRGVVVAVGPGDRLFPVRCPDAWKNHPGIGSDFYRLESAKNWHCHECGAPLEFMTNPQTGKPVVWRASMDVKPGDEVLYWREPMNDARIDNEEMVFLHLEQHILAVLEEGSYGKERTSNGPSL